MPGTYRVEVCPNNRATCKNAECKDAGIKIMKGELRFGTLVEIKEHQSWSYKHWYVAVLPFESSSLIL
jgi:Poly(ADP-ribose) polymerase and DNA-Ligase Zn-finger region